MHIHKTHFFNNMHDNSLHNKVFVTTNNMTCRIILEEHKQGMSLCILSMSSLKTA